jgi:N-acetylmuramoyl-L-alanine amidase
MSATAAPATRSPRAVVRACRRSWPVLALLLLGCAGATVTRTAPPVVALDPGHPSETSSGGELQNGTTEVHEAWMVALELERRLRDAGVRVVKTKEAERELVTNARRAIIGNAAGAALMVRLHCDASRDSGFAIYYPDRAGTVDGRTGPPARVIRASGEAARVVHEGMAPLLRGHLKDGGVRGESRTLVGSRQGALTGSIYSEIPVILVEMVTLSNPRDAAFIRSPAGRARMADALAAGVLRYLERPRRQDTGGR